MNDDAANMFGAWILSADGYVHYWLNGVPLCCASTEMIQTGEQTAGWRKPAKKNNRINKHRDCLFCRETNIKRWQLAGKAFEA